MPHYRLLTLVGKFGETESRVHPVLVFDGRDAVLCDAGYPGQTDQIERELAAHGFSLGAVTRIVLSHHDHDHVGALAALKRLNGAVEVAASASEAARVSGAEPPLRLVQAEARDAVLSGAEKEFGRRFAAYLRTVETCPVDRILGPGREAVVDGLVAVPTPGHTEGHLSFFIEESGTLVAGDALVVSGGELDLANPEFAFDLAAAVESVRTIRALAPRRILCYHGGEIDTDIDLRLERLVARYAEAAPSY